MQQIPRNRHQSGYQPQSQLRYQTRYQSRPQSQNQAFSAGKEGGRTLPFYLLCYTILFAITAWFVFAAFRHAQTDFIWYLDGRGQHLPRLIDISRRFREALHSFFAGNGWAFPLYDFSSGLTATDLQIGFPHILAVLCPPDKMDLFYNFLVLFNYYMAGLTFTLLGFYFRWRPIPVLAGALSYTFCGFAIHAGVRHPHFMVAMWMLPLLIIGTEKVLRKENSWLLMVMVFLSMTTQWGLYFSCINAAMVVLYMTVRFFDLYKKDRLREYVRLWGRMCIWGGIGALLAGVVLVPSLLLLTGTGRVGREITAFRNLFHYTKKYYLKFLTSFAALPDAPGDWTILGFSVLAVPCLIWLFTRKGRPYRTLRILFLILTGMLWVPAVGYMMSGFSNISNRFCYAYALCVSSVIACMFPGRASERVTRQIPDRFPGQTPDRFPEQTPDLFPGQTPDRFSDQTPDRFPDQFPGQFPDHISAQNQIRIPRRTFGWKDLILQFAWLAFYTALPFITRQPFPAFRILWILSATIPVLLLLVFLLREKIGARIGIDICRLLQPAFLLILCLSVCLNASLHYDPRYDDYVSEFTSSPYTRWDREQYGSLAKSQAVREDDAEFFRVTGDSLSFQELTMAFYHDLNGVTMYPYYGWSEQYLRWLSEMEYNFNSNRQEIYGLGTSARMLSLAGVKYFAHRQRDGAQTPTGFTQVETVENGKYSDLILRNENALPLGYTYDSFISREDYDALSPLDRQESLMRAILLEDAPTLAGIANIRNFREEGNGTAQKIPYTIDQTDGLSWKDGKLKIHRAGAGMTLVFSGLPETETYLRIVDLDLTDGSRTRRWKLSAQAGDVTAYADFAADAFPYANMQHTQLLSLGYAEEGISQVTITFPRRGIYKLQDLEIWCQPEDALAEECAALRAEPLENIRIGGRTLNGSVTVSKDKILCLAIPWLDGWSAYLDGEQVPLLHANTAFMGIELPAGSHEIELRYMLPGLLPGLVLSAAGLVCLLILLWSQRRVGKQGTQFKNKDV